MGWIRVNTQTVYMYLYLSIGECNYIVELQNWSAYTYLSQLYLLYKRIYSSCYNNNNNNTRLFVYCVECNNEGYELDPPPIGRCRLIRFDSIGFRYRIIHTIVYVYVPYCTNCLTLCNNRECQIRWFGTTARSLTDLIFPVRLCYSSLLQSVYIQLYTIYIIPYIKYCIFCRILYAARD